MTAVCPKGHTSSETDFCDVCGTRIDGAASVASTPIGAPPGDAATGGAGPQVGGGPAAPSDPGRACPNCQSTNPPGGRYCEDCGYDFVAGVTPAPAVAPAGAATAGAGGTAMDWVAVVTADRDYYERNQADGISFPTICPERRFTLRGNRMVIGRHSVRRGIAPEIDLTGPPEDPGISHLHAVLVSRPDGWEIVDPGSSNGTFVNDSASPLAAGEPRLLADGDTVHLGAWTTLTVTTTGR